MSKILGGWGFENMSSDQRISAEKRGRDVLQQQRPRMALRRSAKKVTDEALLNSIREYQELDGIESGFCFNYLFEALFGNKPTWLPQIIGSCFPAGTKVLTPNGREKNIEDLQVGDYVIGHSGQARKVVHLFNRNYTGDLHTVRARGSYRKLSSTHCHKFATVKYEGKYGKDTADLENITWVEADRLTTATRLLRGADLTLGKDREIDLLEMVPSLLKVSDLVSKNDSPYSNKDSVSLAYRRFMEETGQDVSDNLTSYSAPYDKTISRYIPASEGLFRLLGLYAAEGGTDRCRVEWTFSAEEESTYADEVVGLVKEIFGLKATKNISKEHNRATVRVNSKTLQMVFDAMVPGNIYTKRVPEFVFQATSTNQMAFVKGWLDGDGHYAPNGSTTGVSVSEDLVLDIAKLLGSQGICTSVGLRKAYKRSRQSYCVSFGLDANNQLGGSESKYPSKKHKSGLVSKVRSIKTKSVVDLKVYDIEVEEDHSFIANGLVVHNCVQSSFQRQSTYRSLAESFLLGEPEHLPGEESVGTNNYSFFSPFSYAAGRHLGNLTGMSDGSFGSEHIRGAIEYGMLRCDTPGLISDAFPEPQTNTHTYKQWGSNDQLLNQFKGSVKNFLIESEPVNNATDAEELICNHFKPLHICSDYAIKATSQRAGRFTVSTQDKRDSWAHAMSLIGCVTIAGRKYFIGLNQWDRHHAGEEWFLMTADETDGWLRHPGTVCNSVGDIDLCDNTNNIFGM